MPASWVTLPHSATAAFAQQSSTRLLQPSVLATPTASNLPTRQLLPSTSLQTTPVLDPYSLQSPIQNAVAGFTVWSNKLALSEVMYNCCDDYNKRAPSADRESFCADYLAENAWVSFTYKVI
ncbi:uncharacterized protein LOC110466813 [Mizuhopecten yessoensis]|uniref:uncharacterized protein LOC110466813 n=1 Tax=Mizuhopecten yessoensis TaxID=6573 RepID=UPI000B45F496|nr:uncharacterized protein LOC110466813 [Mizuhopecten yessoensis]